jgi:regulator of sirC expression with transglutaminase-like and TPR domain
VAVFLAGCAGPAPRSSPAEAAAAGLPTTNALEALVAAAHESIVTITPLDREGRDNGVGAGFIIDPEGLIATSLHVIGEARPMRVTLADGRRLEVTEVLASDRQFDLAILRVATRARLPALKLGDSARLAQGAPVVALGNPLGLRHSVVQGVVSARREFEGVEMIQLAIPLEPGNSGGPLLDLRGRVQGVLTLKSALTPNLGFAMPVNLLKTLIDRPNPVSMERWLNLGTLDPREWSAVFGARWSRKAGRIAVEGAGEGFGGRALCLSREIPPAAPFELEVQVKLDDEAGAAGLAFGADGGPLHFGFYPTSGNLRLTRFNGPNVFAWQILREVNSPHYRPGDWNTLRVRVEDDRVRCFVNGHPACEAEVEAADFAGNQVGLAKFRETRAEFRGFRVGTNLVAPAAAAVLDPSVAAQVEALTGAPEASLMDALRARPEAARGFLEGRARQLDRGAARLRALAAQVHEQAVGAELVRVLAEPEERIDLALAALLVARLDNPDLDPEPYRRQLREMAGALQARLPAGAPAADRVEALRRFLFTENGFHGSRSDFYNRANSYLDRVLDDREGLPITLAILFLELARATGIDGVSGLPLPGHFMVRFQPADGPGQILDVFNGGRVVTLGEAQEIVAGATGEGFTEDNLRPAGKRDIIVRMLRNLLGIAERGGQPSDRLRYLDTLLLLDPDNALDRLARARLQLQLLDIPAAKADLKWILDRRPPGIDADRLAELYRSL